MTLEEVEEQYNFDDLQNYPNVGYIKGELQELSFNGNNLLRPYNSELLMTQEAIDEWHKCAQDKFYFYETYCKILSIKEGIINITLRDYQKDFLNTLHDNRFVISAQSRRAGKTTSVALEAVHSIVFEDDFIVGISANLSQLTIEIVSMIKSIYELLPPFLQSGVKKWNARSIHLSNGSMVKSAQMSGNSFRGLALSLLIADECNEYNETITIRNKKTGLIETVKIGDFYSKINSNNNAYYLENNDYEVLTPNGFKDFDGIKKTIRYDNIKLTFNDSSTITTTPEHRLLVASKPNIFRRVSKLKINDKVQDKKIISIDNNIECSNQFFDLINVQDGNIYNTSSVVSHNCAFVDAPKYQAFEDSVMPTLATSDKTKIRKISTPNGLNHFHKEVQDAKEGVSGYVYFEVTWKDIDFYTEEWAKEEIKRIGPVLFSQNYGVNFIGSSYTLIPAEGLMKLQKRKPIIEDFLNIAGLNIYVPYNPEAKYIVSCDTSKTVGVSDADNDYICINILELNSTIKQVGVYRTNDIHYTEISKILFDIGTYYNNAIVVVENNEGAGQSIVDNLFNVLEYENVYKDPNPKLKGLINGTRTTTRRKFVGLRNIKKLIEINKLEINDPDTIDEFFTFIKKGKSYEAQSNTTDDCIMSLNTGLLVLEDDLNEYEITINDYIEDIVREVSYDEDATDIDFFASPRESITEDLNWLTRS